MQLLERYRSHARTVPTTSQSYTHPTRNGVLFFTYKIRFVVQLLLSFLPTFWKNLIFFNTYFYLAWLFMVHSKMRRFSLYILTNFSTIFSVKVMISSGMSTLTSSMVRRFVVYTLLFKNPT